MADEEKPTVTEGDDGAERDAKPKTEDRSEGRRRRKSLSDEARDRRLQVRSLEKKLEKQTETLTEMGKTLKAQEDARKAAEAKALNASRKAIALKHGIPDALVDRLKGATEEEIEADALEVAKALPSKPATPANGNNAASPANPASGGSGLTLEQLKKMTPKQIMAHDQKEVQRVLSEQ